MGSVGENFKQYLEHPSQYLLRYDTKKSQLTAEKKGAFGWIKKLLFKEYKETYIFKKIEKIDVTKTTQETIYELNRLIWLRNSQKKEGIKILCKDKSTTKVEEVSQNIINLVVRGSAEKKEVQNDYTLRVLKEIYSNNQESGQELSKDVEEEQALKDWIKGRENIKLHVSCENAPFLVKGVLSDVQFDALKCIIISCEDNIGGGEHILGFIKEICTKAKSCEYIQLKKFPNSLTFSFDNEFENKVILSDSKLNISEPKESLVYNGEKMHRYFLRSNVPRFSINGREEKDVMKIWENAQSLRKWNTSWTFDELYRLFSITDKEQQNTFRKWVKARVRLSEQRKLSEQPNRVSCEVMEDFMRGMKKTPCLLLEIVTGRDRSDYSTQEMKTELIPGLKNMWWNQLQHVMVDPEKEEWSKEEVASALAVDPNELSEVFKKICCREGLKKEFTEKFEGEVSKEFISELSEDFRGQEFRENFIQEFIKEFTKEFNSEIFKRSTIDKFFDVVSRPVLNELGKEDNRRYKPSRFLVC